MLRAHSPPPGSPAGAGERVGSVRKRPAEVGELRFSRQSNDHAQSRHSRPSRRPLVSQQCSEGDTSLPHL